MYVVAAIRPTHEVQERMMQHLDVRSPPWPTIRTQEDVAKVTSALGDMGCLFTLSQRDLLYCLHRSLSLVAILKPKPDSLPKDTKVAAEVWLNTLPTYGFSVQRHWDFGVNPGYSEVPIRIQYQTD